uniref:Uncharacterized protein n=1 Tax=Oryza brachyantha TaxID=4533 RepID=J3L4C6_ORYBR
MVTKNLTQDQLQAYSWWPLLNMHFAELWQVAAYTEKIICQSVLNCAFRIINPVRLS